LRFHQERFSGQSEEDVGGVGVNDGSLVQLYKLIIITNRRQNIPGLIGWILYKGKYNDLEQSMGIFLLRIMARKNRSENNRLIECCEN
jgi:hypothetical protein